MCFMLLNKSNLKLDSDDEGQVDEDGESGEIYNVITTEEQAACDDSGDDDDFPGFE